MYELCTIIDNYVVPVEFYTHDFIEYQSDGRVAVYSVNDIHIESITILISSH